MDCFMAKGTGYVSLHQACAVPGVRVLAVLLRNHSVRLNSVCVANTKRYLLLAAEEGVHRRHWRVLRLEVSRPVET